MSDVSAGESWLSHVYYRDPRMPLDEPPTTPIRHAIYHIRQDGLLGALRNAADSVLNSVWVNGPRFAAATEEDEIEVTEDDVEVATEDIEQPPPRRKKKRLKNRRRTRRRRPRKRRRRRRKYGDRMRWRVRRRRYNRPLRRQRRYKRHRRRRL